MSKEETFYKLKYPTFPNKAQVEELHDSPFGLFVLYNLVDAVLLEAEASDREPLLNRFEKDPVGEVTEFFEDISHTTREDLIEFKKATLNEFIKLMVIADEMENG